MAETAFPDGFRLLELKSVDSTNTEALRLAADGEAERLWVMADEQRVGKGRQSRTWVSPPGNLYASLLLRPNEPVSRWGEIAFVAGLSVRDAVAGCMGSNGGELVRIKWPNDVLIDGRKVSGILLESDGIGFLAIGCGINCTRVPPAPAYPATSLAREDIDVSPSELMGLLADRFSHWLARWEQAGFAPVRERWLDKAAGLGEEITARLPSGDIVGRFEAIDDTGQLVLVQGDGTISRISAGEVFFAGSGN